MFRWNFRPDYADTDAMGVLYHGSYWRHLERARVEWLREMDLDYARLEEEGFYFPLRSCQIEYLKPLHFDELLSVDVMLIELGAANFSLGYEIRKNEILCTQAQTTHVVVGKGADGVIKPRRLPKEWRKIWQARKETQNSMSA